MRLSQPSCRLGFQRACDGLREAVSHMGHMCVSPPGDVFALGAGEWGSFWFP